MVFAFLILPKARHTVDYNAIVGSLQFIIGVFATPTFPPLPQHTRLSPFPLSLFLSLPHSRCAGMFYYYGNVRSSLLATSMVHHQMKGELLF